MWPEHIHAELLWHKTASEGAKQQWDAYLNHRDGLSGNRPDNSWRPKVQWRWSHRQNRRVRAGFRQRKHQREIIVSMRSMLPSSRRRTVESSM